MDSPISPGFVHDSPISPVIFDLNTPINFNPEDLNGGQDIFMPALAPVDHEWLADLNFELNGGQDIFMPALAPVDDEWLADGQAIALEEGPWLAQPPPPNEANNLIPTEDNTIPTEDDDSLESDDSLEG